MNDIRIRRAALLVVGCLAIVALRGVTRSRVGVARVETRWVRGARAPPPPPATPRPASRRLQVTDADADAEAEAEAEADAEAQQRHMRWYLGGLYAPIDSASFPLYLRDTPAQDIAQGDDLVFFWHVPKAAGNTVKNVLNFCFNLKRAEQLTDTPSMDFVRDNILNMDTRTPDGLAFSFANQLVGAGNIDVIASPYFLSGAALFTNAHRGKAFTVLRHPVEVALSLFQYRRKATLGHAYREDFNQISFRAYVNSEHYATNWMVRQLTATPPWVELKDSHLDLAKRLLRQKVFVGELGQLDETFRQLQRHFGWQETAPGCVDKYVHATNATTAEKMAPRGGGTWKLLVKREKWDMSLYYYGLELFGEQARRYPPL